MNRVLLAALCITVSAFAANVTAFSNIASFEAALSSYDTWTFTGPDLNPVIILNNGTNVAGVSTQGGDAQGVIYGNALCGSTGGGVDCFKPVVITMLQPVTAFGYDNLDLTLDEESVVNVAFSNGDPSQQFLVDLGGQPIFTPIFLGLLSDQPISTVTIYSRDMGSTAIGGRANVEDNIVIGVAATPEPATVSTLAAGLAVGALTLFRRRRSQH